MAMKEAGSDDLYALGKSLKISGYSFHIYKRELVVLSLKKKNTHTHPILQGKARQSVNVIRSGPLPQ